MRMEEDVKVKGLFVLGEGEPGSGEGESGNALGT